MKQLTPYEEKLLLKEVSDGNEQAFRTIYDAYFHRLSAYIFKFCKSPAVTEEIIQEVFMKAWVHRSTLVAVEVPEAYFLTMARNKAIDHLRRLAKETDLIRVLREQLQTGGNELESKWEKEDLRNLIARAMEGLSEQKKKIFRLSKEEGLDHEEIAGIMHLSRSTVKNHLSETLRHIRAYISQQPGSETLLLLLLVHFSSL